MTIVMWVLGAMVAELAVTVLVVKFIRAGKERRAVGQTTSFGATSTASEPAPRLHPAVDNYAELSALLTALSPKPEEMANRIEDDPLSTTRQPASTVVRPKLRDK